MSGSIYSVSLDEEEASKLTKKEKRLKEEAKQARLKDREDLKKWTPIIFIVPFFWSVKCLITVFMGSLLINLDNRWQCSQNIRQFIVGQIVHAYFFMLIYTWIYIGPYPCKQLKPVAIALGIYILSQFSYAIYGTVIFNLGFSDCRQKAPNLLYHVRFEIGTFWLAFSCFCAYGVRYAWEKYEKNQKKKEMANLKSKSVEDNLDAGDDGDAKVSTKPKESKGSDSDEESEESDLS